MRASRLLSIQMLLETRGRMSAPTLARALEVSVRTLYRDVDELTAAGVPIYAERGRDGGFQLLPGWKTALTGFTPAEAEAVFLSGLTGPAAALGLGAEVERAQLKLLASLPAAWRADARRISSRLHLDPVEWYREAEPVPFLPQVASAVWDGRQLSMVYESWTQTQRRVVHPLGLVLKAGRWYLVATRDQKARTFRVSSIRDAQLLDAPVTHPPDFALETYWAESVRRFEIELFSGEALVAATPRGLDDLRDWNAVVARAVAGAKPARRGQQRVRLRIPIESIGRAAASLLQLSPEVEVLGPPALRRAVVERVAAAADLYGPLPQR